MGTCGSREWVCRYLVGHKGRDLKGEKREIDLSRQKGGEVLGVGKIERFQREEERGLSSKKLLGLYWSEILSPIIDLKNL